MARLVNVQELRSGDLRQADGADVAGVLAEHLVHLLVHTLGLDRHVVEMGLALQAGLALLAVFKPGLAALEFAGGLPFPGHFQEHIQGFAGIGHDAQVRGEHAADLGRLDVHMHEFAAFGVHVHGTGVAVGPAVADAQHQVGLEQGGVAIAMRGLQADHPDHQRVVIGDGAPTH